MTADKDAQRRVRRRDSAGVLLHRQSAGGLEVLLVHPSGWYNKKAPWSLPKGWPEDGETLEQAAVRETLEEAGVAVPGTLTPLDFVTYKNGKRVHGFCAACPDEARPHCASWEVDQVEFVHLDRARLLIHSAQRAFLDRLEQHLAAAAEHAGIDEQAP
jgi:predicted NUDIX family NTP pyrophosphohydrolase